MKKQIVKYFLSAFVFVLLSGSVLFAQQQTADPKERQAPKKEFIREKLKLSKEQKEKIKDLRLESEKKSIDISAEIKKQKLELKELTGNKNITDDKVLEITRKISSLQAEMKEIYVKQWLATYSLLDEKQKELFLRTSPILKDKMGEMRKNIKKDLKEEKKKKIKKSCIPSV